MKQAFRYLLILACYLAFVGDSTADAVTVTLWDQEQGMTRDVLQELVETFNGRYKTTKIQMIHMKSESVRDALEKKKGSDNLPDLLVGDQEIAGAFGKSGLLRNLKTYTNWKRFEGKVVGSVTDKPGRIWGWPLWQNQQMLMFVNRKMVPKIPDDYDSLLEAAKKNSNPENGQYGFAFPLMEPYWLANIVKNRGVELWAEGQSSWKSSEFEAAVEMIRTLKFDEKVVPPECDYTCTRERFIAGQVGFVFDGDWAISTYRQALGVQLAIAPLPQLGNKASATRSYIGGRYLFFNRKLRGYKLQVAKRFAEFLSSDRAQIAIVRGSEQLPATTTKPVLAAIDDNAWLKAAWEASQMGEAPLLNHHMRASWRIMRDGMQRVMTGKLTAKEAVASMEAAMSRVLGETPKESL